jgi:hypothetical protein
MSLHMLGHNETDHGHRAAGRFTPGDHRTAVRGWASEQRVDASGPTTCAQIPMTGRKHQPTGAADTESERGVGYRLRLLLVVRRGHVGLVAADVCFAAKAAWSNLPPPRLTATMTRRTGGVSNDEAVSCGLGVAV